MISFQRRYSDDGWRYGVGERTKPVSINGVVWWRVERWAGPDAGWKFIGNGNSYEDARRIATDVR